MDSSQDQKLNDGWFERKFKLYSYLLKFDDLLNTVDPIVIIEGEAGLGKSTTLDILIARLSQQYPIVQLKKIILADFYREKSDISKVLSELQQTDNVHLFLDGFDEIDTKSQKSLCHQLISKWIATSSSRIWITTRHQDSKDLALLQTKFTKCTKLTKFTLQPFEVEIRKEIFKFWTKKIFNSWAKNKTNEKIDPYCLECYSEELEEIVMKLQNDRADQFIAFPLQARLLTVAFQELFKDFNKSDRNLRKKAFLPKGLILVDIYQLFISKMYYQYCDQNESNELKLFTSFVLEHQLLAFDFLLPNEEFRDLFSKTELEMLVNLKKDKCFNTGIVEGILGGRAKFLHRSLAEYLVAVRMVERLKEAKWKTFIVMITRSVEHKLLYYFFNEIILRDENIALTTKYMPDATERLFKAIEEQNLEQIRECIALGADVNAESPDEINPLQYAIKLQNLEMVKIFVKCGASVNCMDSQGWTVMKRVIASGNFEILKFLLDNGLDVHMEDNFGWTPLMYIRHYELSDDWAEYLLKKNYHIYFVNSYGNDALGWAITHGHMDFYDFLNKHGAKPEHLPKEAKKKLEILKKEKKQ